MGTIKKFAACAPSNIALIKYMGKIEGSANIPENGSLSMTLNDLCTFAEVTIEPSSAPSYRWLPELPRLRKMESRLANTSYRPSVPTLKNEGLEKVTCHMKRVQDECAAIFRDFGLEARTGNFELQLRTANTFPQASGIASSASSFAAITLATALAFSTHLDDFERVYENPEFRRRLAKISRMGSGSSCRSFEGPFVQWEGDNTRTVSAPLMELSHFVLVVSDAQKQVSSSQAHARVKTSPLWPGRTQRVEDRLRKLRSALQSGDLKATAAHAWVESWEMHSLFHTSAEPFSYWEPGSIEALRFLAPSMGDAHPPIVTLDAGPNIHLIVESRFAQTWKDRLRERFPAVTLLEDRPGQGAQMWVESDA